MKKILVVEDTDSTYDLIRVALSREPYEVERIADGSLVLDGVRRLTPDLILLDVMLPGLDGYSVQNQLLENEQTRHIPLLIMTSKNEVEDIFKTATNVTGFLPKPFDVKDLLKKVREIFAANN